jgi:hypothetical protein
MTYEPPSRLLRWVAYEHRAFKEIDTGGNSAGNGGDGYNKGAISSKPVINFEPSNKAEVLMSM